MLRQLWLIGAVACLIGIFRATALLQTSKTLSVEDVKRPVYSENHRYKHRLPKFYVKENVEEKKGNNSISKLLYFMPSSVKKINYGEQHNNKNKSFGSIHIKNIRLDDSRRKSQLRNDRRNEHKKMLNTSENDESWSLVKFPKDSNETKLLGKFIENPLYDLEKSEETFEKVILYGTDPTEKHIQVSNTWIENTLKPGVILVEDVHPSKLPNPPEYSEVPLYDHATKPPVSYGHHKPSVTKPTTVYGHPESAVTRPSIDYNFPKPVHHYLESDTSTKPSKPVNPIYLNTKPIPMRPTLHSPELVYSPVITTHKPTSIMLTNILTHYTPVYVKPPPEPPPVAPPPPIVVIESPSDNYINCGNIQVVNTATFKHCSDVTVVLNANHNLSAATPVDDVIPVAGVPGTPISPANGIVPLISEQKPTIIIPVNEPEEDYDYEEEEDEIANDEIIPTTPAPLKPHKPSTSTSFFSYLQTLVTSLPFIGPISASLWIIFLGPLSFLMVGAMGVASFIFPWLAPRLSFRRSRRQLFVGTLEIPNSAKVFVKNLQIGTFNEKNW